MDKRLMRAFQEEALMQCRFAMIAGNTMDVQLQALMGGRRNEFSNDLLWFAIQSLLVAAATLSKLFWGAQGQSHVERTRAPLRASVGIGKGNPLKDRTLRNAFEHIDEELDRWYRTSPHRNIMLRTIGQHSDAKGITKNDRLQWFDPSNGVLTFTNKRVSLTALAAEIKRIQSLLEVAVQQPLREEGDQA